MKKTELRNKFLKHQTDKNRQEFTEHCNFCVSLLRKSKRNYYSNLNMKDITHDKSFPNTLKPLFSNKTKSAVYTTLKNNKKIVENQNEVGNTFNNYFSNV